MMRAEAEMLVGVRSLYEGSMAVDGVGSIAKLDSMTKMSTVATAHAAAYHLHHFDALRQTQRPISRGEKRTHAIINIQRHLVANDALNGLYPTL
jgi:hypothetical protein